MFIKTLKGYSGCDVQLHDTHIVKCSPSIDYNTRLQSQIKKQQDFSHPYIKTPEIYETGYNNDGLYYCEMEYVSGKTLADSISHISTKSALSMINILLEYIKCNNVLYVDNSSKIYDKVNSYVVTDVRVQKIQKYILQQLPVDVPVSYCHGDLTLENIIVKDNTLYFIDFLDSYIHTKYIDLAKILQDVIYYWSWRHTSYQSHAKNLMIYDLIKSNFTQEELDFTRLLNIINILRIHPYDTSRNEKYSKIIDNICVGL